MLVSAKTAPAASTQIFAKHWPEYAIEGLGLGLFMIPACIFGALFGHPDSPVVRVVQDPVLLRVLMGLAMGATAVALIYSSFGKRSGAHMNPATTLTFLWLGKIDPMDALFYIAGQFAGAIAGVGFAGIAFGVWLSHPSVNYVVTLPGRYGYLWAVAAEVGITFLLMSVILRVSNTPTTQSLHGPVCGPSRNDIHQH